MDARLGLETFVLPTAASSAPTSASVSLAPSARMTIPSTGSATGTYIRSRGAGVFGGVVTSHFFPEGHRCCSRRRPSVVVQVQDSIGAVDPFEASPVEPRGLHAVDHVLLAAPGLAVEQGKLARPVRDGAARVPVLVLHSGAVDVAPLERPELLDDLLVDERQCHTRRFCPIRYGLALGVAAPPRGSCFLLAVRWMPSPWLRSRLLIH